MLSHPLALKIQEQIFQTPYFHDGLGEKMPMRSSEDNTLIDALEARLKDLKDRKQRLFNPQFGSVFSTNNQPTLFATSLYRCEKGMNTSCYLATLAFLGGCSTQRWVRGRSILDPLRSVAVPVSSKLNTPLLGGVPLRLQILRSIHLLTGEPGKCQSGTNTASASNWVCGMSSRSVAKLREFNIK